MPAPELRPISFLTPAPLSLAVPTTPTVAVAPPILSPPPAATVGVKVQGGIVPVTPLTARSPCGTPQADELEDQLPGECRSLAAIFEAAGTPLEWRRDLAEIALCETGRGTGVVHWDAVGDGGQSLGGFQLWVGWFVKYAPGEDRFNPVVNTRVATAVRRERGRYGGAGGWTACADGLDVP